MKRRTSVFLLMFLAASLLAGCGKEVYTHAVLRREVSVWGDTRDGVVTYSDQLEHRFEDSETVEALLTLLSKTEEPPDYIPKWYEEGLFAELTLTFGGKNERVEKLRYIGEYDSFILSRDDRARMGVVDDKGEVRWLAAEAVKAFESIGEANGITQESFLFSDMQIVRNMHYISKPYRLSDNEGKLTPVEAARAILDAAVEEMKSYRPNRPFIITSHGEWSFELYAREDIGALPEDLERLKSDLAALAEGQWILPCGEIAYTYDGVPPLNGLLPNGALLEKLGNAWILTCIPF